MRTLSAKPATLFQKFSPSDAKSLARSYRKEGNTADRFLENCLWNAYSEAVHGKGEATYGRQSGGIWPDNRFVSEAKAALAKLGFEVSESGMGVAIKWGEGLPRASDYIFRELNTPGITPEALRFATTHSSPEHITTKDAINIALVEVIVGSLRDQSSVYCSVVRYFKDPQTGHYLDSNVEGEDPETIMDDVACAFRDRGFKFDSDCSDESFAIFLRRDTTDEEEEF